MSALLRCVSVWSGEGGWEYRFEVLIAVLVVLMLLQVGLVTIIWLRTRMRRRRIPLVIGGWGTRGKSGTERCKAALFHAYGANIFSKTTGCEAMFIHGLPRQEAEEIFLFRPMEKATIYEQVDVLDAASHLGCEVFMYECMALNPRYVEVMQDGWMNDDYATLTNAYPDHEDVQGPSGRNVAEVIGSFMPRGKRTWTCEQQMLPLLGEQARQRGADLQAISAIEADLITDDILERLPYQEHPANLALVRALGSELGLSEEFVFKELADHLIPDLGVLRTYPKIYSAARSLYFTNGMSANERLGCMGNWERLGLHDYHTRMRPHEMLVAVVNNRADRIPRSKVFASILAEDVYPDRIVVIGTNVSGMNSYIEQAVDAHAEHYRVSDCGTVAAVEERLGQLCEELRLAGKHLTDVVWHSRLMLLACGQPESVVDALLAGDVFCTAFQQAEQVLGQDEERLSASLEQVWSPVRLRLREAWMSEWQDTSARWLPDDVQSCDQALQHMGRLWKEYRSVCSLQRQLLESLAKGNLTAAADRSFAVFRKQRLFDRMSFIDDPTVSGDQIIAHITEQIPQGHQAHIIGMQNIKGTGLDFAYRWVAIQKVVDWTFGLKAQTRQNRYARLQQIIAYGDYHYYDARLALEACQRVSTEELWWSDADQERLRRAGHVLRDHVDQLAKELKGQQRHSQWYDGLANGLEPLLDFFDSIKRRLSYRRCLKEYVAGRLSRSRAAAIMKDLVKRQKGGWLKEQLDSLFAGHGDALDTAKHQQGGQSDYSLSPFGEKDFAAALEAMDTGDLQRLSVADIGVGTWRPSSSPAVVEGVDDGSC